MCFEDRLKASFVTAFESLYFESKVNYFTLKVNRLSRPMGGGGMCVRTRRIPSLQDLLCLVKEC